VGREGKILEETRERKGRGQGKNLYILLRITYDPNPKILGVKCPEEWRHCWAAVQLSSAVVGLATTE